MDLSLFLHIKSYTFRGQFRYKLLNDSSNTATRVGDVFLAAWSTFNSHLLSCLENLSVSNVSSPVAGAATDLLGRLDEALGSGYSSAAARGPGPSCWRSAGTYEKQTGTRGTGPGAGPAYKTKAVKQKTAQTR